MNLQRNYAALEDKAMQFKTETINDILIISPPATDIDASNADEFKKDITPLLEGCSNVAINLENVGFMDSAGLGAMLSAFKKVRSEGGHFRIFGMNKEIKGLFELVRMHRLFQIFTDKESAIESLTKPEEKIVRS